MGEEVSDFGHTARAQAKRAEKVKAIASYCWDRALTAADVRSMSEATRRRLARAADVHPPSSWETWGQICDALDAKDAWAQRNPSHPAAARGRRLGRAQWVASTPPPPPTDAEPVRGEDVPLFGDELD